MDSEVKEKLEGPKKRRSNVTAITLFGVPLWVHKRMREYALKLSVEKGKKVTMREAYVEFLKEALK
jgi:hypothetical protein